MKKALFHIHTHHSFDCLTNPVDIVKRAVDLGIDYLVISDHDSLKGSIEARNYAAAHQLPIEVPISAEYYTDIGDIVVVNVPPDFKFTPNHRDLCKRAKAVQGYTIIPHPYDAHELDKIDYDYIDCIEGFNSRSSHGNNELSARLVEKLNKGAVFGSDAHFLKDIDRCIIGYEGPNPFLGKTTALKLTATPWQSRYLSQYIKAWKDKDFRLAFRLSKRLLKKCIG